MIEIDDLGSLCLSHREPGIDIINGKDTSRSK